jgi:Rrf2 family protein
VEYALLAVLELSARYGAREPVRVGDIARKHGIPSQFLVQILLQLKGAGLVSSTRGAAGGYLLVRPPDEISLADVVGVIEGPLDEAVQSSASPESTLAQVVVETWRDIAAIERDRLQATTIAHLVDRARSRAGSMYHI